MNQWTRSARGRTRLLGGQLLLGVPLGDGAKGAGQSAFAWQRDAFWAGLEKQFREMRAEGCEKLAQPTKASLAESQRLLDAIAVTNLPPNASVFALLETNFFQL